MGANYLVLYLIFNYQIRSKTHVLLIVSFDNEPNMDVIYSQIGNDEGDKE